MTSRAALANAYCHLAALTTASLVVGGAGCSVKAPAQGSKESLGTSTSALTATSQPSVRTNASATIQVATWPEAQCDLKMPGSSDSLQVFADDLGVAQFVSHRVSATDPVTALSLDCHDDTGRTGTYTIDLTSDSTFEPVDPALVAAMARPLRPGLTGDPMQYALEDLLARGYGLRPDRASSPTGYARWLEAASVPAREIQRTKYAPMRGSGGGSGNWSGGLLNGPAGTQWTTDANSFVVPTSSSTSGCTGAYLWGGVGGAKGDNGGLLQTGVQLLTNFNGLAFVYEAEFQYATPSNQTSCYSSECFMFFVNPGDTIFSEAWACDANGAVNISGGFGCFFAQDLNTNQFMDCNLANSGSCRSLPAKVTFQGLTAEAIVENNANAWCTGGGTFDDFGDAKIYLDGWDTSSPSTEQDFSTVSNSTLTLTNGSGSPMDDVAVETPNGTTFAWLRGS
jgi:hypothetical protein